MSNLGEASPQYWFGQRENRQFIYDAAFQPDSTDDIFLWEIGENTIRFFKKSMIRPTLKPIPTNLGFASAVEAYELWRETAGAKYRAEHSQRIERVTEAEIEHKREVQRRRDETCERAARAHKDWLRQWPEYPGVERPYTESRHQYQSVCWSCRSKVASDINPTCRKCRWLVCECGACECSIAYAP